MKKMNVAEMRTVDGGYSVSATAYCPCCGKKYTSKITYYWYEVFKVSLYKSTVKINAKNKADACAAKDLGY